MSGISLIAAERRAFHQDLFDRGVLTVSASSKSKTGFIASNGDSGQLFSSTLSHLLADKIAEGLGIEPPRVPQKRDGQTLGNEFEAICERFLKNCFSAMDHLRPGLWIVEKVAGRSEDKVSKYAQYSHLADLKRLAEKDTALASFLGNGYTIAPDVVVARVPEEDDVLNGGHGVLVDKTVARMATLRASNYEGAAGEILHASISCKFTMRSDRAQNTRTEALNLLRNRKGRAPHIVSVTAEPTPSRIASLALGTGDVDCVYHFALPELISVLSDNPEWDDHLDQLMVMIDGKRLRDISDLALDLII